MSLQGGQCLEQALAFYQAPAYLDAARSQSLPSDVLLLLRIAAGDAEAFDIAGRETGKPPESIREAAIFYLQQVLFADRSDSYRVLGVNPDAGDEQIKQHYRWLVRWLHPDRNPDGWEAIYIDRINAAWGDLRNFERRRKYDRSLNLSALPERAVGLAKHHPAARGQSGQQYSAAMSERLPRLVLGGLGAAAVATLGLMYLVRTPQAVQVEPRPDVSQRPALPARLAPAMEEWTAVTNQKPSEATSDAQSALASSAGDMPPPAQPRPVNLIPRTRADASAGSAAFVVQKVVSRPSAPAPAPVQVSVPTEALLPKVAPVVSASAPTISSPTASVPAPVTASMPVVVQRPPAIIDNARAQALIATFSRAYEAGDAAGLSVLFAQGMTDGNPTIANYRRLFRSSRSRRIAISDVSWFDNGDTAIIIASFETTVSTTGASVEQRARGDIRFDLRNEGGELRIFRLLHDNQHS